MRVQLAWRNLAQQWTRTGTAAAGIGFAVLLMLVQLGFYGAVERMATLFYGNIEFDLLIRSPEYLHFSEPATFPQARLSQAAEHPAVAEVYPLDVRFNMWRVPTALERPINSRQGGAAVQGAPVSTGAPGETSTPDETGTPGETGAPGEPPTGAPEDNPRRRGILVMAIEPDHAVFRLPDVVEQSPGLRVPDSVLFDTLSHQAFGVQTAGARAEIGMRQVQVVGNYSLGTGFGADGDVITSRATFRRLFPDRTAEQVSLGLVRLKPEYQGREAEVLASLVALLPNQPGDDGKPQPLDVEILSREQVEDKERFRWMWNTSIGLIFLSGVALAVVVGIVVTYQVLASDIANRLAEFATLKAMGYHFRYLARVVVQQALLLAVFGYVPGYLISLAVYHITAAATKLPLEMTPQRRWGVLAITLGMCTLASLAAVQKVRRADPAELF